MRHVPDMRELPSKQLQEPEEGASAPGEAGKEVRQGTTDFPAYSDTGYIDTLVTGTVFVVPKL